MNSHKKSFIFLHVLKRGKVSIQSRRGVTDELSQKKLHFPSCFEEVEKLVSGY
jgi:hypothetical protein